MIDDVSAEMASDNMLAVGKRAQGSATPESLAERSSTRSSGDSAGTRAAALAVDVTPARSVGAESATATAVAPAPQRREFASWSARYAAQLMGVDAVTGLVAVVLGIAAMSTNLVFRDPQFTPGKIAIMAIGAAIAWPISIAINRGYERASIGVGSDEMRAVASALILAVAAGGVFAATTDKTGVVMLCTVAAPTAAAVSIGIRFAARKYLHRQQRLGRNVRKVIVVGSAYAAADLATQLEREPHYGMRVVGVCVPKAHVAKATEAGLKVIGDLDQASGLITAYGADAVAVAGGDATRHNYLRELSWALEGTGVELLVHPGLVEVAGPRMHIRPYVGLPLLHVEQPHFSGWRRILKRATDIVLTSLGLVLISPILLGIALAVKLGDGGPIVFRQTRVGLDGKNFTMLKFRSMHIDAEARLAELRAQNPGLGMMFKMENDPRITAVGRFIRKYSLDELPQLFNVLAGSMSLVGPRPPLLAEVEAYEDHARRRLLVTPGLTGLWQVSGRSLLSWEETVRLDLRYVENWTLTLDLLIMWKTFFAVVAKRGAF